MTQAARANGAIAHRLFGFGSGHHVGKGFVFRPHMRGQHHGRGAHQHQRHQVFAGVKRHIGDQGGVHAMSVKHHRKGVAVWRRGCHLCRTNGARGAALVFHHNVLTQLLRQHGRQDARHLVHRAPRGEHRHQLDGLARRPSPRATLGLCLRRGLGLGLRTRQWPECRSTEQHPHPICPQVQSPHMRSFKLGSYSSLNFNYRTIMA